MTKISNPPVKEQSSRLISGASDVVMKAANILEAEIAAGIVMAKRAEEKLRSKTKENRGDNAKTKENLGDNEKLIDRFRGDAHQIVDILADMVLSGLKSIAQGSQNSEQNETPVIQDSAQNEALENQNSEQNETSERITAKGKK